MARETIVEPEREIPVIAHCDVLVVGGGSAGVAAAVAAARAGRRVVLAERYGSLGGLATGGLIALLLTLDDGAGRQVIGGLCQELVERMRRAGGAFHPPEPPWGRDEPALAREYLRSGRVWGGARAPQPVRYAGAQAAPRLPVGTHEPHPFLDVGRSWRVCPIALHYLLPSSFATKPGLPLGLVRRILDGH